jgi:hypothetical protein
VLGEAALQRQHADSHLARRRRGGRGRGGHPEGLVVGAGRGSAWRQGGPLFDLC